MRTTTFQRTCLLQRLWEDMATLTSVSTTLLSVNFVISVRVKGSSFKNVQHARFTCTVYVELPFFHHRAHQNVFMQSKACQTKAWKATHKGECSDIDLPSLTPQGSGKLVVAAMRAFARKHMNVLTSIAMDAMDADNEPQRGFRDSLVIRLKLHPNSSPA